MKIFFRGHNSRYGLEHLARMFLKDVTMVSESMTKRLRTTAGDYAYLRYQKHRLYKRLFVIVSLNGTVRSSVKKLDGTRNEREALRVMSVMFYDIMSEITRMHLPWGILTGVRPLKIVSTGLKEGIPAEDLPGILSDEYRVSRQKAELACETAAAAEEIAATSTSDSCSVYISIPFCPSRCSYCSFVSQSIEKEQHLVGIYLVKLHEEIKKIAEIIDRQQLRLRSIYIGGGTPSVLSVKETEGLCRTINEYLRPDRAYEYSFEAGRPDTITLEKLLILKEAGVSRISINPQTFSDAILERIGRRHSSIEIYRAFEAAEAAGITNVNADLIAGLPTDSAGGFSDSLTRLISLKPASISVHTLTIKRASRLRNEGGEYPQDTGEMVQNAYDTLKSHQYRPYYLYRQKQTLENLENIGYSQKGYEGLYNVYIMDELHTILSAGAGGVTKIVDQRKNRIERVYGYKYPLEYIKHFDEVLRRKEDILSGCR